MSIPVDISFQGTPRSRAVEEAAIKHAGRLERIHADLMRCRISLTVGARHQHQGKPSGVNVRVFMPHQTHTSSNTSNEDPHIALHEVFSHVERMPLEAGSKHLPQS